MLITVLLYYVWLTTYDDHEVWLELYITVYCKHTGTSFHFHIYN